MTSEPPIDFFCAICGASLAVGPEFEGGFVQCPECSRSVPVPGALATGHAAGPAFSREILAVQMSFACPGCERVLQADARLEGEAFECPACETSGHIPRWTAGPHVAGEKRAALLTAAEVEFLSGALPAHTSPESPQLA